MQTGRYDGPSKRLYSNIDFDPHNLIWQSTLSSETKERLKEESMKER